MLRIDGDRLLARLSRLREFGAAGTGVVRPTYSIDDMASRNWLVEEMQNAGLDAAIDGIGNVLGRSRTSSPAFLIGSHTDTQPTGGWLDGAMGVIYGVEIAHALHDHGMSDIAVDVASWADEEGTYGSFAGSRSFFGELTDDDLQARNTKGETLVEALARVGLAGVPRMAFDPQRHQVYLEAHIEQGPHLEDTHKQLGIVSSIVGLRALQITFTGEQNHAGTTPMARRKDAGMAMFDFAVRVNSRLQALAGPTTVWTIGNCELLPGGESIIPGRAWCGLQFRDADEAVLDRFEHAIAELAVEMTATGPVAVEVESRRDAVLPAHMDESLRRHLSEAAEHTVPGGWVSMPSAAAHDAQIAARHLPTAMLFIPSLGGISHDFAEDSRFEDIVLGCQVLADAVVRIAAS